MGGAVEDASDANELAAGGIVLDFCRGIRGKASDVKVAKLVPPRHRVVVKVYC